MDMSFHSFPYIKIKDVSAVDQRPMISFLNDLLYEMLMVNPLILEHTGIEID